MINFLITITSAITNGVLYIIIKHTVLWIQRTVFVVWRVFALWGHNRRILIVMASAFVVVYLGTIAVGSLGDL